MTPVRQTEDVNMTPTNKTPAIDPSIADRIDKEAVLYGKQMKEKHLNSDFIGKTKTPVKYVNKIAGLAGAKFTAGGSVVAAEWICDIIDEFGKDQTEASAQRYQAFAEEYYRAAHRYEITHDEREFDKIPGIRLYHAKYKEDYVIPKLE
jgi:hypothetical protein